MKTMRMIVILVLLCILDYSSPFVWHSRSLRSSALMTDLLADSTPNTPASEDIRKRIETIITENKVVLFMKGSRMMPKW